MPSDSKSESSSTADASTPPRPPDRSVLRDRFLYGTLILGSTLGLLALDHFCEFTYGFLALGFVFGGVSWIEVQRMFGARSMTAIGLLWVWLGLTAEWAHLLGYIEASTQLEFRTLWLLGFPMLALLTSLRSPPSRERITEIALSLLALVYLTVPLWAFLRLRLATTDERGELWALAAVLIVKGNDIGAFLVGRQFGRTPLTKVSPKKTVEGASGGVLLGVAVALAFAGSVGLTTYGEAIVLGLAAGVAGQLGDLVESLLKRAFEVKDSGALVPAFGGALDMLDSLLFGAPAVYVVSAWTGS